MKILVKELAFTKGQREKTGSIGPHQIGLPDLSVHNTQVKKQKQQEDKKRRLAAYKQRSKQDGSIPSNEIILSANENEEQIADAQDGNGGSYALKLGKPSSSSISNKNTEYNTLEIHNIAMQSIIYGIGLCAIAVISTATFIDAALITEEDKRLVVGSQ
ncbi:Hypothetical predicted protein [Podarcis lilfordi]|uniref:Uncharacterized protein n=1 Tax=Podarcis lilfordi TaxID=74358 RepID=A0AA35PRJ4_9SAUR|nr:Hypothetical predicted protein [Podarcis lilfordi]